MGEREGGRNGRWEGEEGEGGREGGREGGKAVGLGFGMEGEMQVRGRQGERGERIWKVHLCAFSCSQHVVMETV